MGAERACAAEEGLDSSYIVVERSPESFSGNNPELLSPAEASAVEHRSPERKRRAEDKYVTILTPRKEKRELFLTPVKRTKRSVINGVKTGSIRVYDGSLKIKESAQAYISLVECFKKIENIEALKERERRQSIDAIIRRHLERK